jgi:adenosylhomocysteine nucleosidase
VSSNITAGPQIPTPILVTFAVREEAAFFPTAKANPGRIHQLITGMGAKNATAAVERVLTQIRPALILTCGFAGGLRPDLGIGSVVFSVDAELALEPTLTELGGKPIRFHCSPRVLSTAGEKAALWSKTQADAVEMESGAIRQLARERGIASATIRAISDGAGDDLPLDFNQLLTDECRLDYGRLAKALARRPGKIPGLLKLQRHTRTAARRLGEFLQALLALR